MKIRLDCIFAVTDSYGTIKATPASADAVAFVEEMAVGGLRFTPEASEDGVRVTVEGDDASDKITTNAGKAGQSVYQIGFKKAPGRKTAAAVNIFLRKTAKSLEKSGSGCNALLVRNVEALE